MVHSGRPIDAERALALGLVHRVVRPERLIEEAEQVASTR